MHSKFVMWLWALVFVTRNILLIDKTVVAQRAKAQIANHKSQISNK